MGKSDENPRRQQGRRYRSQSADQPRNGNRPAQGCCRRTVVPAWFITELVAKHNDKVVLSSEFGPSVSKNPYLAFKFKGGAKGDKIIVLEGQQGRYRTDEAAMWLIFE